MTALIIISIVAVFWAISTLEKHYALRRELRHLNRHLHRDEAYSSRRSPRERSWRDADLYEQDRELVYRRNLPRRYDYDYETEIADYYPDHYRRHSTHHQDYAYDYDYEQRLQHRYRPYQRHDSRRLQQPEYTHYEDVELMPIRRRRVR